ncbi:hypothetical protein PR048_011883 [Dryococelus australis]|uniref:Uncharacterized protein n=1 Tax=Dryococelus australis TaxID=614101 RepID=A0ABQ9HNC3_9NEOP|nr:hypothetical protein PR048_011883 [Dryococelus australis]
MNLFLAWWKETNVDKYGVMASQNMPARAHSNGRVEVGTAVAELLECSPPTKANRVQSPAGPPSNFCMSESFRTMPLVEGFCRGSPISPALSFRRCSILTSTPSSALMTSLVRAAQVSILAHSGSSGLGSNHTRALGDPALLNRNEMRGKRPPLRVTSRAAGHGSDVHFHLARAVDTGKWSRAETSGDAFRTASRPRHANNIQDVYHGKPRLLVIQRKRRRKHMYGSRSKGSILVKMAEHSHYLVRGSAADKPLLVCIGCLVRKSTTPSNLANHLYHTAVTAVQSNSHQVKAIITTANAD